MNLPVIKHEDERRMLAEYISDIPIRTSKVIFVKKNSILGNHYHKVKDDVFFLVRGSGIKVMDGKESPFTEGECIFVKAGSPHAFSLKAGSILIESSTTPYDKTDEYEI